jgi:hypothetical protein
MCVRWSQQQLRYGIPQNAVISEINITWHKMLFDHSLYIECYIIGPITWNRHEDYGDNCAKVQQHDA